MCSRGILKTKDFLDQKKRERERKLSINQSANKIVVRGEDGHLENRTMNVWGETWECPDPGPQSTWTTPLGSSGNGTHYPLRFLSLQLDFQL